MLRERLRAKGVEFKKQDRKSALLVLMAETVVADDAERVARELGVLHSQTHIAAAAPEALPAHCLLTSATRDPATQLVTDPVLVAAPVLNAAEIAAPLEVRSGGANGDGGSSAGVQSEDRGTKRTRQNGSANGLAHGSKRQASAPPPPASATAPRGEPKAAIHRRESVPTSPVASPTTAAAAAAGDGVGRGGGAAAAAGAGGMRGAGAAITEELSSPESLAIAMGFTPARVKRVQAAHHEPNAEALVQRLLMPAAAAGGDAPSAAGSRAGRAIDLSQSSSTMGTEPASLPPDASGGGGGEMAAADDDGLYTPAELNPAAVSELKCMGFEHDLVCRTLQAVGNDLNRAVERLLYRGSIM